MSDATEDALVAAAIVLNHAKIAHRNAGALGDSPGVQRAEAAIANARGWLDRAAEAYVRSVPVPLKALEH